MDRVIDCPNCGARVIIEDDNWIQCPDCDYDIDLSDETDESNILDEDLDEDVGEEDNELDDENVLIDFLSDGELDGD